MTREQCLQLLMLLSALESWAFATKERLPDYLLEKICENVEVLREEILK